MSTVASHLNQQQLLRGVVAVVGLRFTTTPAVAHGTAHTSGQGIDLPVVIAIVSMLGVSAGLLAVIGRDRFQTPIGAARISRIVGLLFVGIGTAAVGSVFQQQPTTAVGGLTVGIGAGVVVTARGGCVLCATVGVGAIATHRLVEGITLVALSVTGTAVSLLGVLVLAGHTVAECVAIGLQPEFDRLQAVGAVLTVTAVFVLGSGIGVAGLETAGTIPTGWIAAIIGSLLVTLGVSEIQPKLLSRVRSLPA